MKKIICTILTVVMIFGTSIPVFASSNISVNENSIGFAQPRASLAISSNSPRVLSSTYSTYLSLTGYGDADVTITLEKKSGSSWEYVDSESWSGSSFKNKTISKQFQITQSGTYRCVSYVYATVNGNSDSNEKISTSFTK